MTKEEQLERLRELVQADKYWRVYSYEGRSEEDCYEYVSSCFFTETEALVYLLSDSCDKSSWDPHSFVLVQARAVELGIPVSKDFTKVNIGSLEKSIAYIDEQIAKLESEKQDLLKQKERL